MNRRQTFALATLASAGSLIGATPRAAAAAEEPSRATHFLTRDGVRLEVQAWGEGPPMVFLSSWALGGDMWTGQRIHFADLGYRCITFDRRGHGRSERPAKGYGLDQLADDVAALMDHLDLRSVVLVGHSMGGAEAIRYLGRHGAARVDRLVLLAAVAPYIVRTDDNPWGAPMEFHEAVMARWAQDFPAWAEEGRPAFFADGATTAMQDWLFRQLLTTPPEVAIASFRGLLATDLRPDLARIDRPTLIIHGDRDASAPLEITGHRLAAGLPAARLEVVRGAPHGLFVTHREVVNGHIERFIGSASTNNRS